MREQGRKQNLIGDTYSNWDHAGKEFHRHGKHAACTTASITQTVYPQDVTFHIWGRKQSMHFTSTSNVHFLPTVYRLNYYIFWYQILFDSYSNDEYQPIPTNLILYVRFTRTLIGYAKTMATNKTSWNNTSEWPFYKKASSGLLNDGEGVHMPPPPLTFFALSFLIDFFSGLSGICSHHYENYRELKISCSDWDISEKHFFALPPPTLGSVAQTTHAWKFCSW